MSVYAVIALIASDNVLCLEFPLKRPCTEFFLVRATLRGSFNMLGVRSAVYQIAQTHLAYARGSHNSAITYEQPQHDAVKNLIVTL